MPSPNENEAPSPTESQAASPTENQPPHTLTVDEAAALMRVNRKTVYEIIAAGQVPGVRRLGRTIRIHRETLLRWLADGQGRAPRHRSHR